jgi:hypothetical protein
MRTSGAEAQETGSSCQTPCPGSVTLSGHVEGWLQVLRDSDQPGRNIEQRAVHLVVELLAGVASERA